MEIIHLVLGKANPNRMNGVNKVVNSLATQQSALGFDVTVWGITNNMERNFPERNYKTELFPSLKSKVKISQKLLDKISQLNREDVVHLHGGFIPEFYHISRALKKAGIRYVLTPHGAYNRIAMKKSRLKKKLYFNCFERVVAQNASALHCIGQSEIDELNNLLEQNNGVLIPNGQDLEELRADTDCVNEDPVFGFCGRIDIHTKGLDLLLKGFADYLFRMERCGKLWIIGDGDEMPELKSLAAELNIGEHVKFWGKAFGDEKLAILSGMDAFFHPSRNEGLPGAVLEAAGMKIPCVVSRESNMADYINESGAGIGMKENSIEQIALAMKETEILFRSGEIKVTGENAFQMVENKFDWSCIAKQLIAVYKG